MALILGIDRFLSMFRALVNMVGNGVATIVISRWEAELTPATLRRNLDATISTPLKAIDPAQGGTAR
jgi:aerobic C4-dicarboxylate transport protein